jgi:hypothetical protein
MPVVEEIPSKQIFMLISHIVADITELQSLLFVEDQRIGCGENPSG